MRIKRFFLLLAALGWALLAAAQIPIRGRVTLAPDGEPAIGATVRVKGTTTGAVTDLDGAFALTVPDRTAVLEISYSGFVLQEIPVGDQTAIDVMLADQASLLGEVVVVGYGTQRRETISGSVATLTSEEITESPVLRIEQALQGRTAGVQVASNSGAPGSPLTVRIRGQGTINNSDPLYVVDGVPVDGIDFLNTNDIENLVVLKDAASAAIYGSRGANGVVLITTRGGRREQPGRIDYDAYYGVQRPARLLDMLDASEYAALQNEAYIAAGRTPPPEFARPEALGEGTDWQEAVFQNAPIMSHNLTFTGGAARSAYTVSANWFDQQGIVGGEKSGFQRATVRLNGQHDVRSWLTLGNNLGFTWLRRQFLIDNSQINSPLIRALNLDPVTPVRKADGTYAYSYYADTDIANPVNAIDQTFDTWRTNRFVGSAFADLRLGRGLSFRSTFGLDATYATQNTFYPKFDLSNVPAISDAPATEKRDINSVALGNNTWRNWQWENVLTWTRRLAERHDLTLTAGTTALKNRHDYSGGGNSNLPSNDPEDAYISNTIDPIETQTAYQGANESSLFSGFGRIRYALDEKYLLETSFRADGSSRFGRNNRFGYFPAVSAGWVVSREDFWNVQPVSFLKLRASWGQNGNDRIDNYGFSTVVLSGQNYTFGPNETITNGSVALRAANPDLKWETSTQTDIGVDLELLEGRLALTTDYYIKKTSDLLYEAPIPLTAGTAPPIQNVASAENRGWELSLHYRQLERAFTYSVGGNVAFVRNEVTGLGRGGEPRFSGHIQSANSPAAKTDIGHPMASFFGYVTDGIFQSQAEVEAHAFQSESTRPGDIRFRDLNGDNVIDIDDRTYIGNPTPEVIYGLNADFGFKGFDLSVFVQGTQGNDIYNGIVRYDFAYVNRPASALGRWTGPGTSNDEPRVSLTDPNQNARVSDRFVEDGSYLRLKTVQLGYSLPTAWLRRATIQKLRIYVTGQNLLTFTDYSGFDPEIGTVGGALEIGIDRGFYPQPRMVLGGLNLTF
jgi:TonB-linked SusC/RagA family outer membrane protein